MKKYFLLVWLLLSFAGVAWAVDSITNFDISRPTTTTLYLSWTNGLTAAAYDSLTVVQSDSTCDKVLAALTATSTTLTSLTPHTRYIYYVRGHLQAGGYTVSNLDTLFTNYPELESSVAKSVMTPMQGARRSETNSARWDTLYVANTTSDSTMVYWAAPYTALQYELIGHADSCKVKFTVYNGQVVPSQPKRETGSTVLTGKWRFAFNASDSTTTALSGYTIPDNQNIDASEHFYIRAVGQTGNGNATKARVYVYRKDQ